MENWEKLRSLLTDLECIEIGAPTPAFMKTLPDFPMCNLYDVINSLDSINIFENNPFQSKEELVYNFEYDTEKFIQNRYNIDASGDGILKIDRKYDCLIASHVIEHIANPIKAINLWKTLIRRNGYLLLIAPEKSVSHDRFRQYTTLEHIINDYINNIDGSDLTHVEEILRCNAQQYPIDKYKLLIANNNITNVIHHHCFDVCLLDELGKYCGIETILCFNYDKFTFQNVYLGQVK